MLPAEARAAPAEFQSASDWLTLKRQTAPSRHLSRPLTLPVPGARRSRGSQPKLQGLSPTGTPCRLHPLKLQRSALIEGMPAAAHPLSAVARTEALGCGMAIRQVEVPARSQLSGPLVQSTHKAAQPATAKRSVVRFPTAKARFPPRGSDFVRRDSHMFTAHLIGQPSRRPSEVLIQVS